MVGISHKYPAAVMQVHQIITFKIELHIMNPNILAIAQNNWFIAVAPEVIVSIEAHIGDRKGAGHITKYHSVLRIKGRSAFNYCIVFAIAFPFNLIK